MWHESVSVGLWPSVCEATRSLRERHVCVQRSERESVICVQGVRERESQPSFRESV